MADDGVLDSSATPGKLKKPKSGGRRLNKKPVLFVGVVFMLILLLLAYSIAQRGKKSKESEPETERTLTSNAQSAADNLISQYDRPPEIPKELETPEVIPEIENFATPLPIPEEKPEIIVAPQEKISLPPVVSDEELARLERLEKLRSRREQLLLSALTSKTGSMQGQPQQGDQQQTENSPQNAAQKQAQLVEQQRLKRLQALQQPTQPTNLDNIERLLATIAQNTGLPNNKPSSQSKALPLVGNSGGVPAVSELEQYRLRQLQALQPGQNQQLNNQAQRPVQPGQNQQLNNQAQRPVQPGQKQPQQSKYEKQMQELRAIAPAGTFSKVDRAYGYSLEGKRAQLTKYDLRVGTIIPAVMISGIVSDLPGEVIAQVSRNVFDSTHGEAVVIPQGTRLVGAYINGVSFGQNRLGVVWNRLQFPDGHTLALGGINGSDKAGFSGFKDKVNNHYLRTFGGATLLSLISGLAQTSQSDNNADASTGETVADAIGQQYAQVGTELVKRNLDTAPTITIRPGYQFSIILNKDLVLDKYTNL